MTWQLIGVCFSNIITCSRQSEIFFVLMSQWVLFNANSAIVQLYYGVNYQWDDDEVRFVLNQDAELDLYETTARG
jgi:hypothetical protein